MKIGKENVEKDKVLRFAVIAVVILFLIGALIIAIRMTNPIVDSSEGKKKLAALEEVNVQTVDSQIQELEKAEEDARTAWKSKAVAERMEGCLVFGDMTVLRFQQNDILSKSRVVSSETVVLSNGDDTGLADLITTTVEAAPNRLFLQFGRADAELGTVDAATFATAYQALIENLKGQLPNTDIYVCSVPGVRGISGAEEDAADDSESDAKTQDTDDAKKTTTDDSKSAGTGEKTTDDADSKNAGAIKDSKSAESTVNKDTGDAADLENTGEGTDAETVTPTVDLTKYRVVAEYNTALKSLCKSEHVKYIDNTGLNKDEYFGDDGVTLKKAYLEACINNMLEVAFRRNVNK